METDSKILVLIGHYQQRLSVLGLLVVWFYNSSLPDEKAERSEGPQIHSIHLTNIAMIKIDKS